MCMQDIFLPISKQFETTTRAAAAKCAFLKTSACHVKVAVSNICISTLVDPLLMYVHVGYIHVNQMIRNNKEIC
jgi:hypothetical protein